MSCGLGMCFLALNHVKQTKLTHFLPSVDFANSWITILHENSTHFLPSVGSFKYIEQSKFRRTIFK